MPFKMRARSKISTSLQPSKGKSWIEAVASQELDYLKNQQKPFLSAVESIQHNSRKERA
jgi:hypothetical protein